VFLKVICGSPPFLEGPGSKKLPSISMRGEVLGAYVSYPVELPFLELYQYDHNSISKLAYDSLEE
jgi:hypothetical protein